MHTLILCCAGESKRFPNERPKWSLTHPGGNIMAVEAIREMNHGFDTVVVAMREDHMRAYGAEEISLEMRMGIGNGRLSLADVGNTGSHVESARVALKKAQVRGSVTFKDCDNVFHMLPVPGNAVAVVDLHTCKRITPGNKSYVVLGDGNMVKGVADREIASPWFCCGGYSFRDAEVFLKYADGVETMAQVVNAAIVGGESFDAVEVGGYEDWGTLEDWRAYCATFRTLFVDVDGVLVGSSHRTFRPEWGKSAVIQANVDALNKLHAAGRTQIILTTSRPQHMRDVTEHQLAGLRYDQLVMGLRACSRVLVNDVVPARGEQTALAINLERDSATLGALLGVP